jgi:hypothetical protein
MDRIAEVLEPWPEARQAVALAMLDLANQSRLPGEWSTPADDDQDDDQGDDDAGAVG